MVFQAKENGGTIRVIRAQNPLFVLQAGLENAAHSFVSFAVHLGLA
jgi:hypothetical protein